MMCLSLWKLCQYDKGEVKKGQFNQWAMPLYGGFLDWVEHAFSGGASPQPHPKHLMGFILGLIMPPSHVLQTLRTMPGQPEMDWSTAYAAVVSWVGFLVCWITSFLFPRSGLTAISYFFYLGFCTVVVMVRVPVREAYNIEGGKYTDACIAVFAYPLAVWQVRLQCEESLPVPVPI